MVIKKRCLLWDWTNTANLPTAIENINFAGPLCSIANWNAWSPPELKDRLPFRPTVRGLDQVTDPNEWAMVCNNEHAIIHYFNEPERAGISPSEAVSIWMEKIVPLRKEKGKKLVGPSCASDEGGEKWLEEFMRGVGEKGEMPDYLGLHYYGEDGAAAIEYVEKMHKSYPTLPIIISELASTSRDPQAVLHFTAQVANWLDAFPYVFEYAFFGCMAKVADDFVSPAAQLMNPDGSLTVLMGKIMSEQPICVE